MAMSLTLTAFCIGYIDLSQCCVMYAHWFWFAYEFWTDAVLLYNKSDRLWTNKTISPSERLYTTIWLKYKVIYSFMETSCSFSRAELGATTIGDPANLHVYIVSCYTTFVLFFKLGNHLSPLHRLFYQSPLLFWMAIYTVFLRLNTSLPSTAQQYQPFHYIVQHRTAHHINA